LTLALPAPAPRAGELLLGVRPEHAELGSSGWPLKVDMLEMLGAERLVYGRLGEAAFTLRMEAVLKPPQRGDTVYLHVDSQQMHWYDTGSGRRVLA
jgi:sn-glycerol 3-phosphate transport system ATP-binding protein